MQEPAAEKTEKQDKADKVQPKKKGRKPKTAKPADEPVAAPVEIPASKEEVAEPVAETDKQHPAEKQNEQKNQPFLDQTPEADFRREPALFDSGQDSGDIIGAHEQKQSYQYAIQTADNGAENSADYRRDSINVVVFHKITPLARSAAISLSSESVASMPDRIRSEASV
jgi:outer membrane biosynthesis protein TonB